MKVFKDNQKIVITAGCTRDEISDAIAVLDALRKEMKPDNRPHFPKARPEELFLANLKRHGLPKHINVKF